MTTFDHTVHVAKRFQELRPFDGNLHCNTRLMPKMETPGGHKARRPVLADELSAPMRIYGAVLRAAVALALQGSSTPILEA